MKVYALFILIVFIIAMFLFQGYLPKTFWDTTTIENESELITKLKNRILIQDFDPLFASCKDPTEEEKEPCSYLQSIIDCVVLEKEISAKKFAGLDYCSPFFEELEFISLNKPPTALRNIDKIIKSSNEADTIPLYYKFLRFILE